MIVDKQRSAAFSTQHLLSSFSLVHFLKFIFCKIFASNTSVVFDKIFENRLPRLKLFTEKSGSFRLILIFHKFVVVGICD